MEKRYAIVRVDGRCPAYEDYIFCGRIDKRFRIVDTTVDCNKCKIRKYYGDTKEQLVRKIVSYMNRLYVEQYQNNMAYTYEKIAKEIIEFLGEK